ncbi:hypothetical protein EB810_08345 [Altererythrobacter sp. FM1]|uniref:hypothetical protein n=1 Tax=Tsuneonella flava TaxID=2055955 RepID=UPI000C7FF55A|nr:hypothetical protein [Tsuneonella flava]ROT95121.1 hypothetical protein EB810_08345 [Altererythrobacter sp. FM1]
MTRRADNRTIRVPGNHDDLPAFDPVPRKSNRHDGWTPERQRAFIGALADTGSVKRAAMHVNMSTVGAYYLRRQAGAEGFRRAWECALDFGVQRLKDEAFERALNGQLSPVFVGGKLKGFRRVKNDRLLMFCLRMNMRGEDGRRLSASYFDPGAFRLSGSDDSQATTRLGASMTAPALTRAEKDDMNAAMIEHFDPVQMSLPDIEAMQAKLAELAAWHRAEENGPPDGQMEPHFVMLGKNKDWADVGELEGIVETEDELEPFNPDEDDWRWLDENDGKTEQT